MKPDYTKFLDQNLEQTEIDWSANPRVHETQEQALNQLLASIEDSDPTILEVGCGTGIFAGLVQGFKYTGVDQSEKGLELARKRSPEKTFIQGDVRSMELPKADIVCSFAVLKHFGLHEWDQRLAQILAAASKWAIFTQPIADQDRDGVEPGYEEPSFPHVWVTMDRLEAVLKFCGFKIKHINKDDVEWTFEVERC